MEGVAGRQEYLMIGFLIAARYPGGNDHGSLCSTKPSVKLIKGEAAVKQKGGKIGKTDSASKSRGDITQP
jgi:hypothetical protein